MPEKSFIVYYQYKYSDPKKGIIKARNSYEAAKIVEKRRLGNYVLKVVENNGVNFWDI